MKNVIAGDLLCIYFADIEKKKTIRIFQARPTTFRYIIPEITTAVILVLIIFYILP